MYRVGAVLHLVGTWRTRKGSKPLTVQATRLDSELPQGGRLTSLRRRVLLHDPRRIDAHLFRPAEGVRRRYAIAFR